MTAFKMNRRPAPETAEVCAHCLRGTGTTEYLGSGGDPEVAARIAEHERTRTTQLYNRYGEEMLLEEIDRICI